MAKKTNTNPQSAPKTEKSVAAEEMVNQAVSKTKESGRFPYAAFIMCVGAALGHLAGTYLFPNDLMTCTGIGMGVGILAAFLWTRYQHKKADEACKSGVQE